MTAHAAGEEWRREQQLHSQVVEVRRVELLTSCLQSRRSNQLSYKPPLVASCSGSIVIRLSKNDYRRLPEDRWLWQRNSGGEKKGYLFMDRYVHKWTGNRSI